MSEQAQKYVLIEYIGGPWDGLKDVMRYPLVSPEIRIPMRELASWVSRDAIAQHVTPRLGRYVQRGPVCPVTIAEEMLARFPTRDLVTLALQRQETPFHWEGEQ